jgi:hypothetical protein
MHFSYVVYAFWFKEFEYNMSLSKPSDVVSGSERSGGSGSSVHRMNFSVYNFFKNMWLKKIETLDFYERQDMTAEAAL